MPIASSALVHPTAQIDSRADIGESVRIAPFVIVDGPVRVGPDCVIRGHAVLTGPMTIGRGNDIGVGVVLGERPQHVHFDTTAETRTEIGDHNTFREYTTVHRGTTATGVTVLGSNNYLMAYAHIGHDCRVGNYCILANSAMVAGHCELADQSFMSGGSGLHQFVRLGRLGFMSANAICGKDVLPFMILVDRNRIVGINRTGMQRAGIAAKDIMIVKKAYRILYRDGMMQRLAVERLEREYGNHPLVAEILAFIRSSKRGFLNGFRHLEHGEAEAA